APREPDEMSWQELVHEERQARGAARRLTRLALHKRLSLCCAPFALALLGAGVGLRVRRGGRGLGVLLSLACMLAYYLMLLAGTQLGQTGRLPPQFGAWLATILAASCGGGLLLLGERRAASIRAFGRLRGLFSSPVENERRTNVRKVRTRPGRVSLLGLMDRSVLRALAFNFTVALLVFIGIF